MHLLGPGCMNCVHLPPLTLMFSRLVLRITCFEIQSRRKTQENNLLFDVHVTRRMCQSYALYTMWPVTVFSQRFHMMRNRWNVSKIKGEEVEGMTKVIMTGSRDPRKPATSCSFFHPAGLHLFFFSNPAERFADLASDELHRSVGVTAEESILQLWVQQQMGKNHTGDIRSERQSEGRLISSSLLSSSGCIDPP